MTQHQPQAIFIGDAPGLDFLNSVATPGDVPIDWIADGEGYLRWLKQARLVPDDVLRDLRARAAQGELDGIARQARNLREWFRGFARAHMGRPLTAKALTELTPLNRLLELDEGVSQIVAWPQGPFAFALQSRRKWSTPATLLFPIVDALAELVCSEDFSLVKSCEGPGCTLLFADHTRGHARRWCSMALCGNRAKQAKHRRRKTDRA